MLLTVLAALVLSACATRSAEDNALPAETPTPFELDQGTTGDDGGTDAVATPTALAIPATPEPSTEPTVGSSPTATPPPIPTAAPTATTVPTPRPTTPPAPTATPTPNPTSTPTPTPTPAVRPTVSCDITPKRSVAVEEELVFTSSVQPANLAIDLAFDHDDGTIDRRPVSNAYYLSPGFFDVVLTWSTSEYSGTVDCGTVTVVGAVHCSIGLGPADGLGWWCGDVFCRVGDPNPSPLCPSDPPHGCYQGMDGAMYCIDPPGGGAARRCLVGTGPSGGAAWYCDGVYCMQDVPICPTYPIHGCFPSVDGPTICIDPSPSPTIRCAVSKTNVRVGETLVFTSTVTGPEIPVDVVFDHDDGTLDRTMRSVAFYEAPGTYNVTVQWAHANGSGIEPCGTVTVQ